METINKYNFGDPTDNYNEEVLSALHPSTLKAIENYVHYGYAGDFIVAIADNDLVGAVGRADNWNLHHMREILIIFICYCPSVCWGSREKRMNWIDCGGLKGLNKDDGVNQSEVIAQLLV